MTRAKAILGGERAVRESMTPMPHVVSGDQSIADASARMRCLGIHHLPVIEGEEVVGVLSERELTPLVEHGQLDAEAVAVGEVVVRESCVKVPSEAPLLAVVQQMAELGADYSLVMEGGRLAGILTARDAIQLLASVLSSEDARRERAGWPSEVRARILAEHDVLRGLYARTGELAERVLEGHEAEEGPLRERCRELYQTLLRHIELENAVLAPALYETVAFGPVRAEELLREHARQRQILTDALDTMDGDSAVMLARSITSLIADLQCDMAHEERALLNPDLLKDDPIPVDVETG